MGKLEEVYKREGKQVPPFPELGVKILQTILTKHENEFWKLLEREGDLKTFLLDVANSPLFRKDAPPVTNLQMAILILGDKMTKVLALSYLSRFAMKSSYTAFNFRLFWARAITNLVCASFMADLIEPLPIHILPASLLMDYGILLLFLANPQKYLEVLKERDLERPVFEVEQELYGVDHAEIAAEYFEPYLLPRRFILTLRYHHQDPNDPLPQDLQRDLKLIRMIDHAAGSFFTTKREERFSSFRKLATEFLLEPEIETFPEIFPTLANLYLELFHLDDFKLLTTSEYEKEKERLLKSHEKKKETEITENLDPHEILRKYKEEKYAFLREKEILLNQYLQLSERLQRESIFDPLTELYSNFYFQRRLKEELLRSRRYIYPFSLLLLDLEVSQKISQKYGSEALDSMAKNLGQALKKALRKTDLITFLGNGSFIILLPHTPANGAMVVARKLYRVAQQNLKDYYEKPLGPYIVVLNYHPKNIDPKKELSGELLINLLKKSLEHIKKQEKTRVSLISIDRDFPTA